MANGDIGSVVTENELKDRPAGSVNLGRHEAQCSVCCHPKRQEIEEAFVDWGSVASIATQYELNRYSIYRHAHAFGLFSLRKRNAVGVLEKILERGEVTNLNGSTILSAFELYLKLNQEEKGGEQPQTEGQEGGEKESQVPETTTVQ